MFPEDTFRANRKRYAVPAGRERQILGEAGAEKRRKKGGWVDRPKKRDIWVTGRDVCVSCLLNKRIRQKKRWKGRRGEGWRIERERDKRGCREETMISDSELNTLTVYLGMVSMGLILAYSFIENNFKGTASGPSE